MAWLDKVKDALKGREGQVRQTADKVGQGLGKVGDFVDDRTKGKYHEQITKANQKAGDAINKTADKAATLAQDDEATGSAAPSDTTTGGTTSPGTTYPGATPGTTTGATTSHSTVPGPGTGGTSTPPPPTAAEDATFEGGAEAGTTAGRTHTADPFESASSSTVEVPSDQAEAHRPDGEKPHS